MAVHISLVGFVYCNHLSSTSVLRVGKTPDAGAVTVRESPVAASPVTVNPLGGLLAPSNVKVYLSVFLQSNVSGLYVEGVVRLMAFDVTP